MKPIITSNNQIRSGHVPDPKFFRWCGYNLPHPSTGYLITDIDKVICNWKTRRMMFLELKKNMASMPEWQRRIYADLSRWIQNGIGDGWRFDGWHLLQFENAAPDDGETYMDGRIITEEDLINFLTI
jgi:hypothetical protein